MATEINSIRGNCPVQAEGRIDGVVFYFRARGKHWSLSIGTNAEISDENGANEKFIVDCVIDDPAWEHEEHYCDGPYDAGWMENSVAKEMIEKGANMWRAQRN